MPDLQFFFKQFRHFLSDKKQVWTVCLLLAAAVIPRIRALDWGMPLKYAHIDESVTTFYALRVLAGDPNPQVFFDYPGLFLYLLAFVFRLLIWMNPSFTVSNALEGYLHGDSVFFTMTGRMLNVGLSVLTVLLLYRIGRRWGNPFVGITAAGLLVVNRLHVLHSHYAMVDIAAVLISLLAIERILEFYETRHMRSGIWASFLIGLAAATKYYPGILVLFLLPAPFLISTHKPFKTVCLVVLFCTAGFALGSPYSFLSYHMFLDRFMHLFPKIFGMPGGSSGVILLPTVHHLYNNAGILTGLFGLLGIASSFKANSAIWKLMGAMFLVLFLFFGIWNIQLEHYALLLYPLLFLFAAKSLTFLSRFHHLLPGMASVLLIFSFLPATCRQLTIISEEDTRLTAIAWIRQNIPDSSQILRFAHTPNFNRNDPYSVKVDWENTSFKLNRNEWQNLINKYHYILYSSYISVDNDGSLSKLKKTLELKKTFTHHPPVYPHHPVVYVFKGKKPWLMEKQTIS